MTDDEIRGRAIENLERQRRFSVLFVAYALGVLVLIAVWGLTGAGYFWPGWAIVAGAVAFLWIWATRSWSDRDFSEVAIRTRTAQVAGRPPRGVQR